jgi:hypothetical protein
MRLGRRRHPRRCFRGVGVAVDTHDAVAHADAAVDADAYLRRRRRCGHRHCRHCTRRRRNHRFRWRRLYSSSPPSSSTSVFTCRSRQCSGLVALIPQVTPGGEREPAAQRISSSTSVAELHAAVWQLFESHRSQR